MCKQTKKIMFLVIFGHKINFFLSKLFVNKKVNKNPFQEKE